MHGSNLLCGARRMLAVLTAAVAVVAVTSSAAGSDTHRTFEPHDVIATGLDNPRHLAVNSVGRLHVAEAGRGGDQLVDTPLGDSDGPVCVGLTGRISQIVRGEVRPVISSLPSVAEAVDGSCTGPEVGFFATGPHGLAVENKMVTYSIGLGGTPPPRDLLAAAVADASKLGTVNNPHWRQATSMTDLAAFEVAADPDMSGPDSNPYGLLRKTGSMTLAADAGANAVLEINRYKGTSVVAVFAPRCVPWQLPFPNPIPPEGNPCGDQARFPAQAVPTAVAEAANGDYLVTTLGGFPFAPGYSRVFRIAADHGDGPAVCSTFGPVPASGCEVFADGLTALVDLDIAPDGKVYVVQFADAGVLGPGGAGSVQILHHRTGAVMGSIVGLELPGGIAIDGRDVFISNMSVSPGQGEIVVARTLCTLRLKAVCQAG